jgi:hypothetical protein
MSAVSGSLTINDGQVTPVGHTFAPEVVGPSRTVFAERSAGVSAGYIRLVTGLAPANGARATTRVDVNLDYPVLQTVNGVSTVAYTGRFFGKFTIPDVMTAAERANLHAYVANALDQALIKAEVKDLDPLY